MSSKHGLWAAIRENWGQITMIGGILVTLHVFVMWVMVGNAVNTAFDNNIAKAQKIINMDTNIADNKRTGEENGEDVDQLRRANELAMLRLFGLPPPESTNEEQNDD